MKIEGNHRFDASQQEVWEMLMDPENIIIIRKAMPGVKEWKEVGPDQYEVTIKIAVAGIGGTYSGKVALMDHQPPHRYRLTMEGGGTMGFVKGEGEVDLSPDNDKTMMHYVGNAELGGTLASAGQRLAGVLAKPLINQSLKTLDKQLKE